MAYLSGLMHDIGKIGVPEIILNKPARLMEREFAVVKRHPDVGADLLSGINGFEKTPKQFVIITKGLMVKAILTDCKGIGYHC